MSGINYNDLHRVYRGIYTLPPVQQLVVEEDEFEDPPCRPIPRPEKTPPEPEPEPIMETHSVTHDPLRETLKFVAQAAIGYKIADFLGLWNCNVDGGDWHCG